MARLFIAVWLPEEVAETLHALHRKDQRGVRFVPPENWHITLRFLGESDPGDVVAALDGIDIGAGATVARLGPAVDVIDERALVVPVAGVDQLAAEVVERTRRLGSEKPRKRFQGHVTIARVNNHVPMPRVLGALVDDEFDVTEIALIESRLTPTGPRYETLETWSIS